MWTQYFISVWQKVWRLKNEAQVKLTSFWLKFRYCFDFICNQTEKCTRHGRSYTTINLQVGFAGITFCFFFFFDNFLKCILSFGCANKTTTTPDSSDNEPSLYLKSTSSRRHRKPNSPTAKTQKIKTFKRRANTDRYWITPRPLAPIHMLPIHCQTFAQKVNRTPNKTPKLNLSLVYPMSLVLWVAITKSGRKFPL